MGGSPPFFFFLFFCCFLFFRGPKTWGFFFFVFFFTRKKPNPTTQKNHPVLRPHICPPTPRGKNHKQKNFQGFIGQNWANPTPNTNTWENGKQQKKFLGFFGWLVVGKKKFTKNPPPTQSQNPQKKTTKTNPRNNLPTDRKKHPKKKKTSNQRQILKKKTGPRGNTIGPKKKKNPQHPKPNKKNQTSLRGRCQKSHPMVWVVESQKRKTHPQTHVGKKKRPKKGGQTTHFCPLKFSTKTNKLSFQNKKPKPHQNQTKPIPMVPQIYFQNKKKKTDQKTNKKMGKKKKVGVHFLKKKKGVGGGGLVFLTTRKKKKNLILQHQREKPKRSWLEKKNPPLPF